MSTHSSITVKCTDGIYRGIYCQFDGYPDHMLEMLSKYYDGQQLAEEVVNFGDASYIDATIETCCFYHRDRGEDFEDVKPIILKIEPENESIIKAHHIPKLMNNVQEYNYLFDGSWKLIGADRS